MYDHAIFALYSISFMSLVFIGISIGLSLDSVDTTAFNLLVFIPPIHMFIQLRGAYQIGWFAAAWRTIALSIAAVFTLCIYLAIALGMGLIE